MTKKDTHLTRRGVVVPSNNLDRIRGHEDIELIGDAGFDCVRIGLDWSWLQPSAGAVDGDAVEFYLALVAIANASAMTIQFTLLDGDVPNWFDNEGGFGDAKWAGHWWPRWVEACADIFGDHVAGWVPIEHPLGVANRLFPNDPRRHGEVLDTLVTSWRDAWRILRGGPPIITAFGLEIVRPVDQTIPAEHAAKRLDQIRFRLWFQGLLDGIASIPGRADREVADLAGAYDELGIIVRHENDTLGLLHRAAEMVDLSDKPMTCALMLPAGTDADRELIVERFIAQAEEAATGLPLQSLLLSPAFDLIDAERGIITRDRDLKDSGHLFLS